MKKLSEAFIEYIEPVLEYFGFPEPRTNPHDAACALGHVVWNAVVMETLNPNHDYLTEAKEYGGIVMPEIDMLIDKLAARKRERFANDQRLIGVYDIKLKPDGSFSLWAQTIELEDLT